MNNYDKGKLNKALRPLGLKVCWPCERLLSLDSFCLHKSTPSGLRSSCRACEKNTNSHNSAIKKSKARWRKNNPEYNASYYLENSSRILAVRAEYKSNNPEKVKAHSAVQNAVANGILARPTACSKCNVNCKPNGHHESYKKEHWLDVTWLCSSCHRGLHEKEK